MRVLFVGETPDSVDFSDPAIPPGTDADKIRAGIAKAMADMAEAGWDAVECMLPPDIAAASGQLEAALGDGGYDCVVIGGGLRMPASRLPQFEAVIATVRRRAPDAELAFNAGPETTADSVRRRMDAVGKPA